MRLISGSILTGTVSTLLLAFALSGVAQPAETGDPTREIAATIRQTESRARTLKTQIDEVLRNLERPGAQARGNVPGWERSLQDLRAEAAQTGQRLSLLESAAHAVATLKGADAKEVESMRLRFRELDRRLQRLNETIARTERSLQELQREMQEPDAPPAAEQATAPQPKTAPRASEKIKKEPDLSGTWLFGEEEWKITHNPQDGTITLLDPVKHLPGRYLEFKGSVKGTTVTASYQVTDPEVTNPKLPPKVRQQDAARRPMWRLKFQLTKEGKLQGTREVSRLSWNKKTFKITQVRPELKEVVLVRKRPEATKTVTFLPQPHAKTVEEPPRRSPGILPLPERAQTGPRVRERDPKVTGVWRTATEKVALLQQRDRVLGHGVRLADGCVADYTGQAVRSPDQNIVVRLNTTSSDPTCYDNFPPGVAKSVLGKVGNDFEMTLVPNSRELNGHSLHDSVEYETESSRILRIRKRDRWAATWIRVAAICTDQKPRVERRSQDRGAEQESEVDTAARREAERQREIRFMQEAIPAFRRLLDGANPAYRQYAERFRDDLASEYRQLTGDTPSEEVRMEAEYIALAMVDEWRERRDILRWDGGLDENIMRWRAMLREALLGGEGAKDRYGVCANWQEAFLGRFQDMYPQPRHFRPLQLQAHPGEFGEHNSIGITPTLRQRFQQIGLDRAILIDPYRSDGEWYHGRVVGDQYPWQVRRGGGLGD